jgi:hypothetical protein
MDRQQAEARANQSEIREYNEILPLQIERAMSKPELLQKGLTPKVEMLTIQQQLIEMQRDRDSAQAHLSEAKSQIASIERQKAQAEGDYPWSSYRGHARGAADPLLSDHALYLALGADAASRAGSYRNLFREALPEAFVSDLRAATNGGWVLGSEGFKEKVAAMAQRRPRRVARRMRLNATNAKEICCDESPHAEKSKKSQPDPDS